MTNKEKFTIIYKHFAKPIANMKMTCNCPKTNKGE